jgi:UDP-N-acetyl-D-galactosamine dehydrogenase
LSIGSESIMVNKFIKDDSLIAVVGLGYVGLPLAVEFGKTRPTVGFDIDANRIDSLIEGVDETLEVSRDELAASHRLKLSSDIELLREAKVFIVAVPTPIDEHKKPNLEPLVTASRMVGKLIKKDDIVVYESTVFPGATEEICVPILEGVSGLKFNCQFFCGYSPERINPGDKKRDITSIIKVTSGSTPEVAEEIDGLYKSIIRAGTYLAESIQVAEAAKVIENTQRDLNIALVNELAIIFNKLGIDTDQVLRAAQTKWNFLPFRPGLVGGHCIGVDPYYLTYKAESIGYYPQLILAGRRINEGMSKFVVSEIIKAMSKSKISAHSSKALVLGLTFKEDCPDLRNSRVFDVITELNQYSISVDVYDPLIDAGKVSRSYNINCIESPKAASYDIILLAVAHKQFLELDASILREFGRKEHIFYDLKSSFSILESSLRL